MAKPEFHCKKCHLDLADDASARKHLEESPIHIYCAECDQEFDNEAQLESHTHTYHCPNCLRSFLSADALKSHQKSTKWHGDFQCPKCIRAFITNIRLQSHLQSGTKLHKASPSHPNPATRHICTVCTRTFVTEAALHSHMKAKKHGLRSETVVKKTDTADTKISSPDHISHPNPVTSYECTVCTRTFVTEEGLHSHMKGKKHKLRSEAADTKIFSSDDISLGLGNNAEVPNQGDLNDPQVGASRENVGTESEPDEDIEEVFRYIPDTSFKPAPQVPQITVSLKDYLPPTNNEENLQKVLLEQNEALRALQKQFKTFQAASEERERIWTARFERLSENFFEGLDNLYGINERISKQLEETQAKLDKLNDEKDAQRYSQPLINLLD